MNETSAKSFDVFISYTKRRHLRQARALANFLTEKGYSVWFDEKVLARKTSWVPVKKTVIMESLKEAVTSAQCAVIFAMEQELLHSDCKIDKERALQTYQVMPTAGVKGSLVAWNWQMFEASYAKKRLFLYPGRWTLAEVSKSLLSLGIRPKLTKEAPKLLRSIFRRITRRARVRCLFQPLLRPNNIEESIFSVETLKLLSWFYPSYPLKTFVIVGPNGSGRSTFARSAVLSLQKSGLYGLCAYSATLPERDDIKTWANQLSKLPDNSVLFIDDFGNQILSHALEDREQMFEAVRLRAVANLPSLLVMTKEEADECIRDDHLFERLEVQTLTLPSLDYFDLLRLSSFHLSRLTTGDPFIEIDNFSIRTLLSELRVLPITASLVPVNYCDVISRVKITHRSRVQNHPPLRRWFHSMGSFRGKLLC